MHEFRHVLQRCELLHVFIKGSLTYDGCEATQRVQRGGGGGRAEGGGDDRVRPRVEASLGHAEVARVGVHGVRLLRFGKFPGWALTALAMKYR